MIELNLLPEELRKKKRAKIELPEIPLIPLAVAVVVALVVLQFILGGLIFLNRRQLTGLQKQWQALAPKKVEFAGLKSNISSIGKKNQAIQDLMARRLNWSRLLNELSHSLTPNIWLTELKYEEKTEKVEKATAVRTRRSSSSTAARPRPAEPELRMLRTLTLSGVASGKGEETTAHVARFIRALKSNKNFFREFENIELISIKQGAYDGEDVMNFTLVCKLKPEEAAS